MLKIKKQIKNSDGTITELEGTEAEVEAFLKKQSKKDETTTPKKKNLILGKEMVAAIQELIDAALLTHCLRFNHPPTYTVQHHWHQTNGWWWKPYWDNGQWTYMYTQNNPNAIHIRGGVVGTSGVSSASVYTCNSAAEMGSKLGLDASFVEKEAGSLISSTNIGGIADDISKWSVSNASGNELIGTSTFTSGMINMNEKS